MHKCNRQLLFVRCNFARSYFHSLFPNFFTFLPSTLIPTPLSQLLSSVYPLYLLLSCFVPLASVSPHSNSYPSSSFLLLSASFPLSCHSRLHLFYSFVLIPASTTFLLSSSHCHFSPLLIFLSFHYSTFLLPVFFSLPLPPLLIFLSFPPPTFLLSSSHPPRPLFLIFSTHCSPVFLSSPPPHLSSCLSLIPTFSLPSLFLLSSSHSLFDSSFSFL